MTWFERAYAGNTSTGTFLRSKAGNVQNSKGAARYSGSSPYYRLRECRVVGSRNGYGLYSADVYSANALMPSSLQQSLYNRSYDRLRERLLDASTLGTSIAEGRDSLDMIWKRAISVRRALNRIKRGDPKGFLREISAPAGERKGSQGHFLTSRWLEYWLGIAPTIADVEQSVRVLTRDPPPTRVKVASASPYTLSSDFGNVSGRAMVGVYVKVRVSNPNVYLANQLGLLNPAAIAWELVPLSFVFNWFYNVGAYLQSFDTFYGLDVLDSGVFEKSQFQGTHNFMTWAPHGMWMEWYYANYSGVSFERRGVPLPRPRPALQLPKLSLSRAATAVSLLTQLGIKSNINLTSKV